MKNENHAVFARRRDLLRERLNAKKLSGFVTFDFSDVQYLSGFPSEGCFVLVSRAGDFIYAPLLLADHARAVVGGGGMNVVDDRKLLKSMLDTIKRTRLRKIGFDSEKVTVSLHQALISESSVIKWTALGGFVLSQRMIKDEVEIDLISRACRLTTRAQIECFNGLQAGQTEEEVSYQLETLFHKGGSPKPAFETIVAFGENAAYPHHVVTDKKLEDGMTVLMDIGSSIGGYKSDLTRTGFFGKMPSKYKEIYDIVKDCQTAGIAAVKSGVAAGQVDFVCREIIRKAGYGDFYIHGTGHGVGLDIHEPPRLGIDVREILKENMVVTVEPGIYLPGEFGVRIEDTLLVTKTGSKILTAA